MESEVDYEALGSWYDINCSSSAPMAGSSYKIIEQEERKAVDRLEIQDGALWLSLRNTGRGSLLLNSSKSLFEAAQEKLKISPLELSPLDSV
jgi:hypothetical protein